MTLREYYKMPEGTNISLSFIPSFFDMSEPNFPCPPDMSYAFYRYKGKSVPQLDTSNVTTMNNMFENCSKLTSLDVSGWDTSSVTTMQSMFSGCTSLTTLDLDNWNTSSVTTMKDIFSGCKNLTSLNLSNWDTSKVTDMEYMFQNCSSLTSLDLINFKTSKVTEMAAMFYGCSSLTSLNLSSLDTSKVAAMENMFHSCSKLTTLSSIRADSLKLSSSQSPFGFSSNSTLVDWGGFVNLKTSWNGSYCIDKLTKLSHQSLINILNGLYDFKGNGVTPSSSQGKIKFGLTHLAKLSDEEKAIATNKGWVLS